jgi:hypothetical protein
VTELIARPNSVKRPFNCKASSASAAFRHISIRLFSSASSGFEEGEREKNLFFLKEKLNYSKIASLNKFRE